MFRILPFNIRNNAEKGKELVENLVDAFMEQPMNPFGRVSGALSSFRVDVIDAEEHYEVRAELPGFSKEDITLAYEENKYLTIQAEHPDEDMGLKYICHERRTGRFERSFLVDGIREDMISAEFNNGILCVILPKHREEKARKVIDIG
jgi:HSP20 family protein